MANIENAVAFMENIAADNSHGYAQDKRTGNPDYDCSSLVGTALNKAGFNVNALSTTRNLYEQLIKCGFKSISIESTRKRGDIFLTPGKHVVMCTNANSIVHASLNSKGKTTNDTPGDQTGKEICTRLFYMPSYGWKYHMRYEPGNNVTIKKEGFEKGNTYTLLKNLYIRMDPYGSKTPHTCITDDARKYSYFDEYGYAILRKGTKVTCLSIKELTDSTWMLIPSGWICAINQGKAYIE